MTQLSSTSAALTSTEIGVESLRLLHELEASLLASQRALLSRDVIRVEQLTGEQMRLRTELEDLTSRAVTAGQSPRDSAPPPELRMAQMRVLFLGRVQATLLQRAQCWLRMLSNLLAGPEASYSPPALVTSPSKGPSDFSRIREGDSCQA